MIARVVAGVPATGSPDGLLASRQQPNEPTLKRRGRGGEGGSVVRSRKSPPRTGIVNCMPSESDHSALRSIFDADFAKANWHSALVGVAALLAALGLIAVFGNTGLVAALAALFVIVAGRSGDERRSLADQAVFAAVGVVVGYVSVTIAGSVTAVAAFAFVATLIATLAAAWGKGPAIRGVMLVIWLVMALSIGQSTDAAGEIAAAFGIGALIGMLASAIGARMAAGREEPDVATEERDAGREDVDGVMTIARAIRSRVGALAVLRALAVAITVVLGYWLFPDHRMWAALTAVIIVRPPAAETLTVGVGRTLGTVAGVAVGAAAAAVFDNSTALLVAAFLVAAFLMIALQPVSYVLFTAALTSLLLLTQAIVSEDVSATGSDRIWATFVGVATAFLIIGAVLWWVRRRADTEPKEAAA